MIHPPSTTHLTIMPIQKRIKNNIIAAFTLAILLTAPAARAGARFGLVLGRRARCVTSLDWWHCRFGSLSLTSKRRVGTLFVPTRTTDGYVTRYSVTKKIADVFGLLRVMRGHIGRAHPTGWCAGVRLVCMRYQSCSPNPSVSSSTFAPAQSTGKIPRST